MQNQRFKGNYAFCSPNALNNKSTSRRDDFLSLLYILIFLLTLKVPFMEGNIDEPEREAQYRHEKNSQKPDQFCKELDCMQLLEFAEETYSYSFKEKPNYNKLRFLLTKEILK